MQLVKKPGLRDGMVWCYAQANLDVMPQCPTPKHGKGLLRIRVLSLGLFCNDETKPGLTLFNTRSITSNEDSSCKDSDMAET